MHACMHVYTHTHAHTALTPKPCESVPSKVLLTQRDPEDYLSSSWLISSSESKPRQWRDLKGAGEAESDVEVGIKGAGALAVAVAVGYSGVGAGGGGGGCSTSH